MVQSLYHHSIPCKAISIPQLSSPLCLQSYLKSPTMSDKCGNCDCADSSQCKKGNKNALDVVATEKISIEETVVMDGPAAENDGKCKCGTSCGCVNCTCGGH